MFPIRDTIQSRHAPVMVGLLILVNALVFAYEVSLSPREVESFFERFGIVPQDWSDSGVAGVLGEPRLLGTLLSSMFLHGGWLHVVGNLWMLWIFGDNVEDRMGWRRFLVFYLACGVAAGLAHRYTHPDSTLPTIGASGAIAGVMGAYFLLFPHARIVTLIPVFFYPLFAEIPAVVFLGIWFLTQLSSGTLSLAAPGESGGIAFLAHVGGFVAGILLHRLFLRPDRARRRSPC